LKGNANISIGKNTFVGLWNLNKIEDETCLDIKHLDNLDNIAIFFSSERLMRFNIRFVKKSWSLKKVDPTST
jgi:hypothetical protein